MLGDVLLNERLSAIGVIACPNLSKLGQDEYCQPNRHSHNNDRRERPRRFHVNPLGTKTR